MRTEKAKDSELAAGLADRVVTHFRKGRDIKPFGPWPTIKGFGEARFYGVAAWTDEVYGSQIAKTVTWMVKTVAVAVDLPESLRQNLINREVGKKGRRGALFREVAALLGISDLSAEIGMDGIPLLSTIGGYEPVMRPLFDFTNRSALDALFRWQPRSAYKQRFDRNASFESRVRGAMTDNPIVDVVVDDAVAVREVTNLIAAVAEARVMGAAMSHQSNTGSSRINCTVETLGDKLIVEWFYQSRYAPQNFGKSRVATHLLHPGIYGMQTTSLGSPPPVIDSGVHAFDPLNTKSYTSSF